MSASELDLCDSLYDHWIMKTGLSLPLGGVLVKRSLGDSKMQEICMTIRKSLSYAYKNYDKTIEYCEGKYPNIKKSQLEMGVKQCFNDETYQLTELGKESIKKLLELSMKGNSPKNTVKNINDFIYDDEIK